MYMPQYLSELEKRGLTLTEFAKRAQISPTYAASIFRGEKVPSAAIMKRMEEVLTTCPWCHNKWPHPLPKGAKRA
jgi:transcriptional regulator with XRE-family HTH domain